MGGLAERLSEAVEPTGFSELRSLFPEAKIEHISDWKIRISGPGVSEALSVDPNWANDVDFDYAIVEDVQWDPTSKSVWILLM